MLRFLFYAVSLVDFFLLRNVRFLQLIQNVFVLRMLFYALKSLSHWATGKSFLHRLCSEKQLWLKKRGKMTLLVALHLRSSRILSVIKYLLWEFDLFLGGSKIDF